MDIERNSPIKNKTETIGFLLLITHIPKSMENKELISKYISKNPLEDVSNKMNKLDIKIFFILLSKLKYTNML